jgi:hypothetical protein
MIKLGDRNRAFTRKALEIATQNPDFLPRSFDIEEMRRDFELFEALQPILLALTRLQTVAGIDNLVDEMGQRFAQQPGWGRSASARGTNGSSTAVSGS